MVRKKVAKNGAKKRATRKSVVSLKLRPSDSMRLDAKRLGSAVGKVTALVVFIVSVLAMSDRAGVWSILVDAVYGPFGYYPGKFLLGVVWGAVLGYIKGFVVGWLIAKMYNGSFACCRLRR